MKGDPHFEKKVGKNSEIRAASSSLHRHANLKARDRCGGGQVKVEARITEKEEKIWKKKKFEKKMETCRSGRGASTPHRPEANQAHPTGD